MGHRFSFLSALGLVLSGCGGNGVERAAIAPPVTTSARASENSATVPGVTLTTLAGDRVEVARVAAGRVALVSLWATWCEACEREMDALNRLSAKSGSGAVVIGVAVGEEPAKVAEFAQRRGLHYVQLVDPDFAFADAIGQRRIPATLVVDREGRIVYRGDALDAASLDALKRAAAPVN
jgi:cytochrome c biogenesis protein CcmG, thiol:disulfide interchange protein DsbE